MNFSRNHPFLTFLLAITLAIFLALIFLDKIVIFSVDQFTDYNFSCAKWGSVFDRREIDEGTISSRKDNITVSFKKANISPKVRPFSEKRLLVKCDLQDVSLEGSITKPLASNLFEVPIASSTLYSEVSFTVFLDKDSFRVTDFSATSKDVKISASYDYSKVTEKISVNLQMSFAPWVVEKFGETENKNMLFLDEEGWYTATVVNFQGPAVLLEALYPLVAKK